MTVGDIFKFLLDHWGFTLIGSMTLIQIAPIKIDPWSWIVKQIRKLFIGDIEERLEKRLKDMDDRIRKLSKDVTSEQISNKRWNILNFANSCMQGHLHNKEEWNHCLAELKDYEDYCERNSIPNGTMEENAKYLRSVYRDRLYKNDFLA